MDLSTDNRHINVRTRQSSVIVVMMELLTSSQINIALINYSLVNRKIKL